MKKIFLFVALAGMLNFSGTCTQPEEKKEIREQQKVDACRDNFFIRTIKKYPKLTAACVILPFAALLYRNYCLADENQTYDIINRQLVTIKNALEERLSETQKLLADRENFIKTTFHEMNQKLGLLDFGRQLLNVNSEQKEHSPSHAG